ncbi:MAG: SDR family NAD(P)-dependent oxidoreductase [Myxococcales bacterium]|nr:SDR family oxidoreductase [Myxococcota bacterium]MDW8282159.1 SDR family NAD(P)-dependent oxidoreductase [Myxococcales bacterium]
MAKVVLITGATGTLGRAVARAFHAQGAALALSARSPEALQGLAAELGGRCWTRAADLTDGAAAEGLSQWAAAELGRIDVLVHAAGGFRMAAVHETTPATWDWLMDINARSALNLARGVVPIMKGQGAGRIIHIGARVALASEAGLGAYAASKAALLRLTESMARELHEHGITVNAILPSIIDTPQNRQAMPDEAHNRWVSPESLAGVVLFLASEAARDISGAAIPVYGRC